mmetsp:Transcript_33197/g.81510  ORF Transcript_33197/g.81510 Transcript_33197/m.81510 type:complete len:199 (-) Transcript_33197:957-1553(-)
MQIIRSITEVNLFGLPGFICHALNVTYSTKLLLATILPLVICILLCIPGLLAWVWGLKDGSGFKNPRVRSTVDRCGQTLSFLLFVVYPAVSIQILQTFRCDDQLEVLTADYKERCPNLLTTEFNFVYAMLCTLIVPIGVPLFMYYLIRIYKVSAADLGQEDGQRKDRLPDRTLQESQQHACERSLSPAHRKHPAGCEP